MELYLYDKHGSCGVFSINSIVEDINKKIVRICLNTIGDIDFCEDKVLARYSESNQEDILTGISCIVVNIGNVKYYLYEFDYDNVVQELPFLRKVI